MPDREKPRRLQTLGVPGLCRFLAGLTLLCATASALAVETGAELETTREALRTLEQQQRQHLREIERLEERIGESARRALRLRGEQRTLAMAIERQDQAIADQERDVAHQEATLATDRARAAQLLRGQWLRERHPGWTPSAPGGSGQTPGEEAPGAHDGSGHDRGTQGRSARHQWLLDARIQAAREQRLAGLARQLDALNAAREQLRSAQAQQLEQQAQGLQLLREIERQEAERGALLARLQRQSEENALEAGRLERNAETLQRVLDRPAPEVHRAPPPRDAAPASAAQGPFSSRRGALARPVTGEILHRYNSPRGSGLDARWRGEVFAAGDDTPVRAVHAGHAVYADWMRGYGFLVILDHGEGYLTLYGNNRELLIESGSQVAGGDVIARAGATDTVIAPGVYFELRHRGQTLNPLAWWHSDS